MSTLLDALLLYDKVHVLDAQLPSDADDLALRRVLLDRRILQDVDTRPLSIDVSEELTAFLRNAGPAPREPRGQNEYAPAEEVGASVRQLLDHDRSTYASPSHGGITRLGPRDHLRQAMHNELESGLIHAWIQTVALRADPLHTLGSQTLHCIGYWGSGAIDEGVSHLRTFIYWRASAHLRIPFLPSLHRLPVYHLMTDHVRRSVQDRVYEVIADAFHGSVGQVYEDEEPAPLYLPPALALFLDHLRRHKDIAAAVDNLRHQHRKLRRTLAELQQTLQTGSTLGEMRAARRRFNTALEALRTDLAPEDQTAVGTVDQLIDIVPGVVKVAANPLDPVGYAEALLARPADWIRSWWLRRPVSAALRLSTRLDHLSNYERLLEEATGQSCDAAEVDALRRRYGATLDLYGGDSRLPGAPSRAATEPPV
ncbi:hypothetical protein [Streptomyces dubilierae]|uniref:Uncharacterized protein n=1 Tax=Streptomyces dubilierae TaxID=3075533 RepID=A0ABU2PMV3_9ACTN|nr:hypothetical protein [Streptomyces sp. DSM 41921]MDT0393004.1 hypothetical protein [Streptomyces sp. DSM 41921]